MFERDSYSVREDAGSLMYRVIATGTASFGYNVMITGADGSATCELIGYMQFIFRCLQCECNVLITFLANVCPAMCLALAAPCRRTMLYYTMLYVCTIDGEHGNTA